MKKILSIAWKDLLVTISDPAALLLTMVTPFLLTLVMIFAFGGVNNTGIQGIPVAVVNLDESEFGQAFDELFASETITTLLEPTLLDDPQLARAGVDSDQYAAAVIVPDGLGSGLMSSAFSGEASQISGWDAQREPVVIEIYGNPTRPTGVSVVRTIVDEYIIRASSMSSSVQVSIVQMMQAGLLNLDDPQSAFAEVAEAGLEEHVQQTRLISLAGSLADGSQTAGFDWLAYMAPSMAILFLMFTMTNGGKSILAEREGGTLPRMLTTPTNAPQVLGGKVFGIYLNGLTQLLVLMVASLLFFSMRWGPLNVVIPTILCVVAAATGWGMLIAAFAKTPAQANAIGTAITLTFAIGAGSFIPRFLLPEWLQTASLISPNAWGLEAFNLINLGATPVEMLPVWGAMLLMFAVLFVVALVAFRRQYS